MRDVLVCTVLYLHVYHMYRAETLSVPEIELLYTVTLSGCSGGGGSNGDAAALRRNRFCFCTIYI
jgi:hypothetical protein